MKTPRPRPGDLILLDEDARWQLGVPNHRVALVLYVTRRREGIQVVFLVDNKICRRFLATWNILRSRKS